MRKFIKILCVALFATCSLGAMETSGMYLELKKSFIENNFNNAKELLKYLNCSKYSCDFKNFILKQALYEARDELTKNKEQKKIWKIRLFLIQLLGKEILQLLFSTPAQKLKDGFEQIIFQFAASKVR